MDTHTQEALFDEMEKIALGVKQMHQPGLLTFQGLAGKYVTNDTIMKQNPAFAKKLGLSAGGKDALFMAPKQEFASAYGQHGDATYRAIKQHELTHYLRGKKGKMIRYGKPGLRGLGTTAREELAAHLTAAGRAKSPQIQQALARGVVPGTVQSVRAAYPRQRLRDVAMGGSLGKAVGRVRKLFRR